jgi:hypothetical protein
MQNNHSGSVHVSNIRQYIETKIVRRAAVSDNSTLVMCKQKCSICPLDFRLCEFGSCRQNRPDGYLS